MLILFQGPVDGLLLWHSNDLLTSFRENLYRTLRYTAYTLIHKFISCLPFRRTVKTCERQTVILKVTGAHVISVYHAGLGLLYWSGWSSSDEGRWRGPWVRVVLSGRIWDGQQIKLSGWSRSRSTGSPEIWPDNNRWTEVLWWQEYNWQKFEEKETFYRFPISNSNSSDDFEGLKDSRNEAVLSSLFFSI